MEFKEIIKLSKEVQIAYRDLNQRNGQKNWGAPEYTQGLVGDIGDLMKLVMARNNLRSIENVDKKLAHELSDCLWSIVVISEELGIDLEKEFLSNMGELQERIKSLYA